MLGVPWEQCDVVFGNTAKNLPWTCISAGSQTAHAMTRAAHAAATDAIKKLQEIAAKTQGGNPEAYKVAGGKVSGPGRQHDVRAGRAESDRARRQVRRPRAARGHQQLHQDVGEGARRPGPDGGRQGRVSARRPVAVLRRRLRRSRSRHRDRRGDGDRLRRDRRRRHGPQPAQPEGPAVRRIDARPRPRADAALGLRPAIRRRAGAPLLPEQAADDSRRAAQLHRRRGRTCRIRRRRRACAASASRRSARPTARS